MPDVIRVEWIIFYILWVILIIAPGYTERPAPERPKKGFWQARDILWPVRKTLHGLWPANPELLQAYRNSIFLAWLLAGAMDLGVQNFPAFAKAISFPWLLLECAAVGILLGRAWGFWSADRKLQKNQALEDAPKA